MVTILPALGEVREDLSKLLDRSAVERVCRELGFRWRNRQLDPYTTLHLFILQVLHQNTAMTHLPHLSGERFSPSAYCQARQRLPLELLERMVNAFTEAAQRGVPGAPRSGDRIVLIDGSSFSMPDTLELRNHFGQPAAQKPGCGFPVAHLLAMVDAETGFLQDVVVSPMRTHDMAHVAELHPKLSPGDIVVADRGFCSYAHLALLSQAKMHAVFRVHQKQLVNFHPHRPSAEDLKGKSKGMPRSRWIKRLGRCDQIVERRKPQRRPGWMSAEEFASLPETLLLRELKIRVRQPGCRVEEIVLVTTLLDAERYPPEKIARMYQVRWQVEVDLRDLKITLGLDVLKSHKVDTVLKEVLVFALVYNLIRAVIMEAARRQKVRSRRVSFLDAMRWLQPPKPAAPLVDLVVNPERPGRFEPRCKKRRPKSHRLMTSPRRELRNQLKKRRDAA